MSQFLINHLSFPYISSIVPFFSAAQGIHCLFYHLTELKDEMVYKIVQYEEFDTMFSAYQRKTAEKVGDAVRDYKK